MTFKAVGYHGTSMEAAFSIENSGFRVSRGDHHWFGDGAYFFEDDLNQAREWCRCEGYKRKWSKYAIIRADIKGDKVFDLDDPHARQVFHQHRDLLIDQAKVRTKGRRKPKGNVNFDSQILNHLAESGDIQIIRGGCFVKNKRDRISRYASIVANCYIICVRDVNNCIGSIELCERGDMNEL